MAHLSKLKKIFLVFILICSIGVGFSDVNINDCSTTQVLNISSETYLVTQNLTTSVACLSIQADNVTLDCQGHTLTGNGGLSAGIAIAGNRDTITNNCSINNFYRAYYLGANSKNNLFLNSKINKSDLAISGYNSHSNNSFINISLYRIKTFDLSLSNSFSSSYCNQNIKNIISEDKYEVLYFYDSVNISNRNNISSITLCNADNSKIENISFNSETITTPIKLSYVGDSVFNNISMYNKTRFFSMYKSNYNYFNNLDLNNSFDYGFYLNNILNNIFTNIEIFNTGGDSIYFSSKVKNNVFNNLSISNSNRYGFLLGSYSTNNTISNSSISNINFHNFYFSSDTAINNIFYNNYLGDSSKIRANFDFNIYPNYFNYTLSSGLNIGNYWDDLSCSNSILNGSYEICTNPNNYTIDAVNNLYDFAPLVLPSIDVNYISFEEGDYYSESIYIEVNASKDISSCTLFWNGVGFPMTVSADVCYVTKSGEFGNSYDYNVSVVGVNTATALTETNSLNLIDSNVSYVSPTPVDGLNKYNLSNFTILFNDGGLSIDDCIFVVNGETFTNSVSAGFCNYTYFIPVSNLSKNVIDFEGFYNVSGTVTSVGKRTIKSYSDSSVESLIVPGFGVGSLVAFVLLLVFGGLF